MTSLLLASWLLTQSWAWDRLYATPTSPEPTSYRVYWQAGTPTHWCPTQFVTAYTATDCDATTCYADMPEPSGDLVFFNVTAINAAGETPWDHGSLDGPCP